MDGRAEASSGPGRSRATIRGRKMSPNHSVGLDLRRHPPGPAATGKDPTGSGRGRVVFPSPVGPACPGGGRDGVPMPGNSFRMSGWAPGHRAESLRWKEGKLLIDDPTNARTLGSWLASTGRL